MKKQILTLTIALCSLGTFASAKSSEIKISKVNLNHALPVAVQAMTVTLPLACGGLYVTFQYTPAPGETTQEMLMDFAVIQGYANTMYCPPPPPLNEA